MSLKPLIEIFVNWYKKLNSGERRLFFIFTFILLSTFYYTLFLKPALDEVNNIQKQEEANKNQLEVLKSQYPNAAQTKKEIEAMKNNQAALKKKIAGIESKLIGVSQEQQLLTELIKRAQEIPLDLESVKEDIKEDKDGFARAYIDLKFASNFKKVVTYLKKIESISPFLKIEKMELEQSKKEPLSVIEASVSLSAILSLNSVNPSAFSLIDKAKEAIPGNLDLQPSPFTPKVILEKARDKNYKVTGITYRKDAGGSTAIINGKIVRKGDKLDEAKVENILPASVIIDNGTEKETLQLER